MEQKKVDDVVARIQRSREEFDALPASEKERRAKLAVEVLEEVVSKFLIQCRCFDGEEEEALHWVFTRLMIRSVGKDPADIKGLREELEEMRGQVETSIKKDLN